MQGFVEGREDALIWVTIIREVSRDEMRGKIHSIYRLDIQYE